MVRVYLLAVLAIVVIVLASPDRAMERCTLNHSFDVCYHNLNR